MGGEWECDKCDHSFEKPNYSYMVSFKLSDGTNEPELGGIIWANCFNEAAEILLGGLKAETYNELAKADDLTIGVNSAAYSSLREIGAKNSYKRYSMYIRRSESEYQGEIRNRYTAQRIFPIVYQKENKFLLDLLSEYRNKPDKGLEKGMQKLSI